MVRATERQNLERLEAEVRALREALLAAEAAHAVEIAATHPTHHRSAANLIHYVELRRHDIRGLQERLGAVGLSSLGRSEAHVLATIEAVLFVLATLNGTEAPSPAAGIGLNEGHHLLVGNTDRLLGTAPGGRTTRIMVTLPTEAATDAGLISEMVASGMDIARVNCAHDGVAEWRSMVRSLHANVRPNGHRPRIAMDLAGPKVRTGPLLPGPQVVRVAPRRDQLGVVVEAAAVWLTEADTTSAPPGAVRIPVRDTAWLVRRRVGDRIDLKDSRGAKRQWEVVDTSADGCLVIATQTAYVTTGLRLACRTDDGDEVTRVGELPPVEQAHRVEVGDGVVLTRSLAPAAATPAGTVHRIGCTLGEVFGQARPGERVFLDDGKLGGRIARVDVDEIEVEITEVRPGGANLRAGKGINFPDTDLRLDALTAKDIADLDVVARHADIVDLSFVRQPSDVARLQAELERRGAGDVGIVLKVENVAAFEQLPALLLTAMRSRKVGVMIARGDLAVEVGFERLAEVQEEIMWACEAAHVPVIWATQVLDTLARTGQPSRAEVTDAAMSERAECVMLNKGPHIVDAIRTLDSILTRMQHHQHKKRSLLRRLHAWDRATSAGC